MKPINRPANQNKTGPKIHSHVQMQPEIKRELNQILWDLKKVKIQLMKGLKDG